MPKVCAWGMLMKTAKFNQSNSSTSGWSINWYAHFGKLKTFSNVEYIPLTFDSNSTTRYRCHRNMFTCSLKTKILECSLQHYL